MPGQPTYQQVHVDSMLTNISVAYQQAADAFVAAKVFPLVPVQKQSDRYFLYKKEDWFRDEAEKRAPATESAGGGYEIDNTPTYFCEKYAYHKDVTEEDRVNTDIPLNADRDATEFVTEKLMLKREILWAQNYFTTGKWGTDYAGQATADATHKVYWNASDSNPIVDIHTDSVSMTSTTGKRPNTLVLGPYVWNALRDNAEIMDKIKWTQKGMLTTELIAGLLGIERVFVAWGVKNAAAKGSSEDTDFIFGKSALLCYSAPRPGLKLASAGYIFAWSGLMGGSSYGTRINRFQMPMLGQGTERIECEMAFDMKVVAADLGIFYSNIVE